MNSNLLDRVVRSKVLWTLWACLPVAALAWAFGPGHAVFERDRAARLIESARVAEARAEVAQAAAHAAHRAALAARLRAEETGSSADFAEATAAREAEDAAYLTAAEQWRAVAEPLGQARSILEAIGDPRVPKVRVARAKALVRSGELLEGVVELEAVVDELSSRGSASDPATGGLLEEARHELGTGLFFGARLLRHAGASPEEWGAVATAARRQFRFLAESGRERGSERFDEHHHNLEMALDLEQASYEEILGRPLPKQCPGTSNCQNQCKSLAGHCKGKSKGKRPAPRKGDDRSTGAGNNEFGDGW